MVPGISIKVVKSRFIRKDTLKTMDAQTRRFLIRAAGLTRVIARRSMKPGGKKKKRSLPGEAPRAQGNPLLKKFMFFWLAQNNQSILVGPAQLRNQGDVANVLEQGGTPVAGWHKGKYQAPRPFMGPALEVAEPQFPSMWRGNR